jgi:hypothetical protein
MKKIAIVIGSLIALVIAGLLVAPLFISLDDLRPKIEEAANKQVRGKVSLGKLSLSLFPWVKLGVSDVKLVAPGFENDPVAEIESVQVKMSLLSFLTAPSAKVAVNKMKIKLVDRGQGSNLDAFLPAPPVEGSPEAIAAEAEARAAAKGAAAPAVGEILSSLPGFLSARVMAARIDFELNDSEAVYDVVDANAPKAPGDQVVVRDMNVQLEDIGLNSPVKIDATISPDVKMGELVVKGPIRTTGEVVLTPEGSNNVVKLAVEQDLKDLEIRFGALFGKAAGGALGTGLKGTITAGKAISADLSSLEFHMGPLKTQGSLKAQNLQDMALAQIELAIAASNVDIAPFGALIPMVKQYEAGGQVDFKMSARGPALDPTVEIDVSLAGIRGSTPELKKPLTDLNGKVRVTGTAKNPSVVVAPMSMKIGSSDMNVAVNTKGLTPMAVDFKLESSNFDADELLGLEPVLVGQPIKKGSKAAKEPTVSKSEQKALEKAAKAPLDESLEALAPTIEEALQNPFLDQVKANINVSFAKIKVMGATLTQTKVLATYGARNFNVSQASLNGYDGNVAAKMNLGLKPGAFSYNMDAQLKGVQLGAMLETHAPNWKEQLAGAMNGSFKLSGVGLRKAELAKHLRGEVKGDIVKGRLNLPLGKVIEGVGDALPKAVATKAADAGNKYEFNGAFKTMKLASKIVGRKVEIQTIDVEYDSEQNKVGILKFKANGEVDFDQNMDIEGIAFVKPELIPVQGLENKQGQVEIPLRMKGTLTEPKPDYAYTVKAMSGSVAKGVAKQQLKKLAPKAEEIIKKKLPKNVQKKAGDALKKLFK